MICDSLFLRAERVWGNTGVTARRRFTAPTRDHVHVEPLARRRGYGQIGECRKSQENALYVSWAQGVAGSNPVAPTIL